MTPSSLDIDDLPHYVELNGFFMNVEQTEIDCLIGEVAQSTGVIIPNADDDDSTAYCPVPPGGFNGLAVGEHPIEIRVPCNGNNNFTTNRVPFFVTQV